MSDKSRVGIAAGLVIASLLAIVGCRAFFFEPFRAPSGSMAPGIEAGASLIVRKWGYGHYGPLRRPITAALRHGDVIVFDYPRDPSIQYVKRLVGLPGDRVAYRGKQLAINGEPVAQRREDARPGAPGRMQPLRLAETLYGQSYGILQYEQLPAPGAGRRLDFPMHGQCVLHDGGIECTVPPGHYFVMGDNRDDSEDSRHWGFVPAGHIVGRVVYVAQ